MRSQHLLAHELGQHAPRWAGRCLLGRDTERALRQQPDEVLDQRARRPRRCGRRPGRSRRDVELGGRRERRDRARAVEPVDLVDGATTGTGARRAAAPAMKRSPGPDALLAVEHQQRGVGLAQLGLDALLHALGERVARALHAGQVDEHELAARPARWRRRGSPGGSSAGLSETIATLRRRSR